MNLMTLTGVRGGGGTTTMTGILGDALSMLGQRVLLVDLNASDLLRLHFGIPLVDSHGWVASSFPSDWREQAFDLNENLVLVPFGRKSIESFGVTHLLRGDDFWLQVLPDLDAEFDWVLFDCPPYPNRLAPALRFRSTHDVLVAHPDIAAHVLLAQIGMSAGTLLLINDFEPSRQLECDVVLDWYRRYGARVLPQSVYRDETLPESLACKKPITRYLPDAVSSQAAGALARWFLSAVCTHEA
ncbi:cellulose synthase operon protein YhjQ/BcsQ [Castellaniella sp.]|uniref:cellulose synthase operon protein YhjQ/BcsQ n=1 Tax=Castellaniella sp. TaxID=1955812 RepID=UPI003A93588C